MYAPFFKKHNQKRRSRVKMEVLEFRKSPLMSFSKSLVGLKYIQFTQHDLDKSPANKIYLKKFYLNQSYILHLVSYWQVYIESSLQDAKDELFKLHAPGPYREGINRSFTKALRTFNTPSTRNIDQVFKEALGIEKISDSWFWDGVNREKTTQILAEILQLRHKIAHEGRVDVELNVEKNFNYMRYIYAIACCINNQVVDFFNSELGLKLYWCKSEPSLDV